jgi:hypothetical protein
MKLNLAVMNQKKHRLSNEALCEIKAGCDCGQLIKYALCLCTDFCLIENFEPGVYYAEKTYFVGVPEY